MIPSLGAPIAASTASTKGSPAEGAASPPAADDPALVEIAEAERAVYSLAIADLVAHQPGEAWKKAEALFTRYPNVYPVQDLRCKLALQLSSSWQDARPECERLMNITGGKPKKRAP